MGVKIYRSVEKFKADAERHHVTPKTAPSGGHPSYRTIRSFIRKGRIFGWKLHDFRWHTQGRRPKAKANFRVKAKAKRVWVPNFSGQERGQVHKRHTFQTS